MSGGARRWRPANQIVTIADAVDRYQRLNALSGAIDWAMVDPSDPDEHDRARYAYMGGVRSLLEYMARNVPGRAEDRAQALATILGHPERAPWVGQPLVTLNTYWNATRKELDQDIATLAGVPLLLGMVRARDEIIAGLDDRVDELEATQAHGVAHPETSAHPSELQSLDEQMMRSDFMYVAEIYCQEPQDYDQAAAQEAKELSGPWIASEEWAEQWRYLMAAMDRWRRDPEASQKLAQQCAPALTPIQIRSEQQARHIAEHGTERNQRGLLTSHYAIHTPRYVERSLGSVDPASEHRSPETDHTEHPTASDEHAAAVAQRSADTDRHDAGHLIRECGLDTPLVSQETSATEPDPALPEVTPTRNADPGHGV